jgi:hypothetical protein
MGALGRLTKKMNRHRKEKWTHSHFNSATGDLTLTRRDEGVYDSQLGLGKFYGVAEHTAAVMALRERPVLRFGHDELEWMSGYKAEIVYVDELEQVVPPHSQKYPQHTLSRKGSVFQGECNRTACSNVDARHYNKGTFGYYCAPCGWAINGRRTGDDRLCTEVDHNLTHDEMNQLYRGHTFS